MALSDKAKADISWFVIQTPGASCQIERMKYDLEIKSDASLKGHGAVCDGQTTRGHWTLQEKQKHINYLELLAAKLALKAFCSDTQNIQVLIRLDSVTAVSYINKMGGTHSLECNSVARDIWEFCIQRNIWVTAAHLPGVMNCIADRESRTSRTETEWMLNPKLFHTVIKQLDVQPCVDLFASRINHQIKPYVSWHPDGDAINTDAFTTDWGVYKCV